MEAAAFAQLGLYLDRASIQLDHVSRDGKAKTHPFLVHLDYLLRLHSEVFIENVG